MRDLKKEKDCLLKQFEEGNQSVENLKKEINDLLKQVDNPILVELFNKVLNFSCTLAQLQFVARQIEHLDHVMVDHGSILNKVLQRKSKMDS